MLAAAVRAAGGRREGGRRGAATLFGLPGLREAADWSGLVRDCMVECDAHAAAALAAPPSPATIAALDDASDTVCRVYDAAELCRSAHARAEWRAAAAAACATLGAYIHGLNTHAGLYGAVKAALAAADKGAPFPAETARVGAALARDFERAGVHLPPDRATEFAHLTAAAQDAGFRASDALAAAGPAGAGLGDAREAARRAAYEAAHAPDQPSAVALSDLIAARHGLATALGAPSWAAHAVAGGTLAGDAGAASSFLTDLAHRLRPAADAEVEALAAAKRAVDGRRAVLRPWDLPFFRAKARAAAAAAAPAPASVPVEAALGGLADLLDRVCGVALSRAPPSADGAWAPGVVTLDAASTADGRPLGRVFLDVVPRPFKFAGAAHYTLRCGRALPGGGFSAPSVALVASFGGVRAGAGGAPTGSLAPGDLAVLLHEAGHALHSLLSRTTHQHLSGTRGPLDAVEVPSHVAERWARSAASAALATRGALSPLPAPSPTPALDMLTQAVDGLVDLTLHGPRPAAAADAARSLVAALHPLPPPDGLLGHARFGHLVGYGGSYHAYPYADAVAADAWATLGFAADPVDPAAGAAFGAALAAGCAEDPVAWVQGRLGGKGRAGAAAGGGGWAPDPATRLREAGIEC